MSRNWNPTDIAQAPLETKLFYAKSPETHPDTLRILSRDPYWFVRDLTASNPGTPRDSLETLLKESDFRIRRDAEKTLALLDTPGYIAVTAGEDHKWSAFLCYSSLDNGSVLLARESTYPVSLIYVHVDLNGDSSLNSCLCRDRQDLLDTLNWCGSARFSIRELWSFDAEQNRNPRISSIFYDAAKHRLELIRREWDAMLGDDSVETLDSPSTSSLDETLSKLQPKRSDSMHCNKAITAAQEHSY